MRKGFRAMRFVLVLVVALVGVLAVSGSASAKGHGTKHKKCKAGKIAVTINGRAKCTPLRKALPKPKAADQNLAAVQQALGMDLKRLTRHGKKVRSARKLLGAKGLKKLEGAVTRRAWRSPSSLKTAKASALSSIASPFATASGGCRGPAAARLTGPEVPGKRLPVAASILSNGHADGGRRRGKRPSGRTRPEPLRKGRAQAA